MGLNPSFTDGAETLLYTYYRQRYAPLADTTLRWTIGHTPGCAVQVRSGDCLEWLEGTHSCVCVRVCMWDRCVCDIGICLTCVCVTCVSACVCLSESEVETSSQSKSPSLTDSLTHSLTRSLTHLPVCVLQVDGARDDPRGGGAEVVVVLCVCVSTCVCMWYVHVRMCACVCMCVCE